MLRFPEGCLGLLTVALVFSACGDGVAPKNDSVVTRVQIDAADPSSIIGGLVVGESRQLKVFAFDSADNLLPGRAAKWSSSDPSKASVSSTGLVSGIVAGEVTISAEVDGRSGSYPVDILSPAASLEFLPGRLGLVPGGTFDLVVNFRDEGGAQLGPEGRSVTWTNTNPSVGSLTGGINAVVSAITPGTTTITASGSGATASLEVDVASVTFTRLVAGVRHTCGVTAQDVAYCWGSNVQNMLASPIGGWSVTPFRVEGLGAVAAVAPSNGHACALTLAGESRCWGNGSYGQFGDGTSDPSVNGISTPRTTLGGLHFTRLTVGDALTCGLVNGGQAYCWGYGGDGQLGSGSSQTVNPTPVAVSGNLQFATLGSHPLARFVCGLLAGGQAYCWGDNAHGQLGDGSTSPALVPTPVAGGLAFTAISVGVRHACGLTAAGAAYCWGDNEQGQLGQPGTHPTPSAVDGGLSFTSLTAGTAYTCGIAVSGLAYCWGINEYGQLGDGSTTSSMSPLPVAGGLTFSLLTAGHEHTCGLTLEEVAYCWGLSDGLGSDPGGATSVPRRVSGQP